MSYIFSSYDIALESILTAGVWKSNKRTGVRTLAICGVQTRFPLTGAFPVMTRRKYFPKAVFAELLWFISGSTNNEDLKAIGCNFWTPWVDRKFEDKWGYAAGSFGPVYGFQLRHFGGYYGNGIGGAANTPNKADRRFNSLKNDYEDFGGSMYGQGGYDQLAHMMDRIKQDPSDRRILFSLWNPRETEKMKLPPCFVADTPVATNRGPMFIQDVTSEDVVRTHAGVRPVREVMKTRYVGPLVTICVAYSQGVPVTCTPNHPFLVRGKGFVKAGGIVPGDYLALSVSRREEVPNFSEVAYVNQYAPRTALRLDSPAQWYMMGYFVGDGWASRTTNRVSFAINNRDRSVVLPLLRKVIKLSRKPGGGPNVHTYETKSAKWAPVLRCFGHKAHGKRLPSWVMDAPKYLLIEFLRGYADADGCSIRNGHSHTTVSSALALGIRELAWKVGLKGCVYKQIRPRTCVIQGRQVSQRDTYIVTVRHPACRMGGDQKDGYGTKYLIENGQVWLRVEKTALSDSTGIDVYNLSVDTDHTYVANGLVNHNCHYTYQVMIDDEGRMSGHLTQRSNDYPVGVPANIQFYSALTCMIAQQTGYTPYEFVHEAVDAHIYENQIDQVKEYLATPVLESPSLTLNKAPDIYSYKLGDFQLEGYRSGPKIEIPVAV